MICTAGLESGDMTISITTLSITTITTTTTQFSVESLKGAYYAECRDTHFARTKPKASYHYNGLHKLGTACIPTVPTRHCSINFVKDLKNGLANLFLNCQGASVQMLGFEKIYRKPGIVSKIK